jgi:hypothetical protein
MPDSTGEPDVSVLVVRFGPLQPSGDTAPPLVTLAIDLQFGGHVQWPTNKEFS